MSSTHTHTHRHTGTPYEILFAHVHDKKKHLTNYQEKKRFLLRVNKKKTVRRPIDQVEQLVVLVYLN